nr:MAG TPA: hypothetical protein [Bacteriophage sp.]
MRKKSLRKRKRISQNFKEIRKSEVRMMQKKFPKAKKRFVSSEKRSLL